VFTLDALAAAALARKKIAHYHLDDLSISDAAKEFSDQTFSDVIFYKTGGCPM
jgi:hypothetical protein